ncbi:hypothetical protein FH972_009185 [Carpinus fangiana]|uniref:KNOX1 domain-containing protein n=1 Tax=Carpinus fangiana TaxID=176857 RepID=A0A5N6R159_9ROSI|nr:hypothetical protein FH972_009185 [Carpinus fangiana]
MMDEMYGLNTAAEYSDDYKALMSPDNLILPTADYYQGLLSSTAALRDHHRIPIFGSDELLSAASAISEAASFTPEIQREEDMSSVIKARIASHPSYPRLLQAYIDCQKVGAPPEIATLLDEIRRENDICRLMRQPPS